MKKLLVILVILVLLLTSCIVTRPADGDKLPTKGDDTTQTPVDGEGDGDETDEVSGDGEDVYPTSFSYHFYSCWTNWTDDERVILGAVNADAVKNDATGTHLPLYRIDSVEALKKFKEDYAKVFSFGNNHDGAPCFNEKTASKDEAFFEENVIFVAYMNAESGKFKYQIRNVIREGKDLLIEIEQRNDFEEYTDDMPGRLIAVEFLKEEVKSYTSFDTVYVGKQPYYAFEPPPSLTVASPYGEIEAIQSGAHWWGGEMGMIADSAYPYADDFLDNMNYLPNAEFFGEDAVIGKLTFDFARQPDSVHMTRWRIGDEENQDLRFEVDISVTDEGITFPLNTSGCYAYSLRAKWEKVDNVGGSASYYFCVGDREGYYDKICSPQLFVAVRQFELEAKTVSDGWTYPSQDGTENARDSSDVLKEYQLGNLPLISTDAYGYGQQAKLIFDFDGEVQVAVRRWNMEAAKYTGYEAACENVKVDENMTVELKRRGIYVYEVTAVWEMSDGVGGKMTYGFYEGPESTQS